MTHARPVNHKTSRRFLLVFCGLMMMVSFLYGLPDMLNLYELDWDYQNAIFLSPFAFELTDTHHYITQLKEIYDGNGNLANAYLAEYKSAMYKSLWPRFPYFLAATLGKTLHLPVQHLVVLMNIICPLVLFLVTYLFLSTISLHRYLALLGALLLVLTPHLLHLKTLVSTITRFVLFHVPVLTQAHCYHCYTRPINPQLTYIFLLAFLAYWGKSMRTLQMKHLFWAAFWGVVTSYSYVYFSTYLYVFLGLCIIGFFLQKEQERCRQSILILAIILVCSFPFWYSVFSFSKTTLHQMAWMEKNHTPIIDVQILFTLLVSLFMMAGLLTKRLEKFSGLVSVALLLSGVICMNQHVITGIRVQPRWHYNAFVIPQSMILALTLLSADLAQRRLGAFVSRQFRLLPRNALVYGGIAVGIGSIFFHPSFVARHFSSDGMLTPRFTVVLNVIHLILLCCGCGLAGLGMLNVCHARLFENVTGPVVRVLSTTVGHARKHGHFLKILLYVGFVIALVSDIGLVRYDWYQNSIKPDLQDLQRIRPALQWLENHTPKEAVILVNPDYVSTDLITIYTHNNVYISSHAQYYTVPSIQELRDRWYNVLFFVGIRTKEAFEHVISQKGVFVSSMGLTFEAYQDKLQNNLYTELTQYQIDYVLYGPREQKNFDIEPENYAFLHKVYDDRRVKIYRVAKES